METENPGQTSPLSRLFAKVNKRVAIIEATVQLFKICGRDGDKALLTIWADLLDPFTADQLSAGFENAYQADLPYPKPAHVIGPILDLEFAEEFAWLVGALETYGANWADRAGYFDSYESAPNPDPSSTELLRRGVGWHEPRRAPEIPPRLDIALRNFGAGSRTYGLERLAVYLGHESRDAGELSRLRSSVEKEFKSAWRLARVAEGNR